MGLHHTKSAQDSRRGDVLKDRLNKETNNYFSVAYIGVLLQRDWARVEIRSDQYPDFIISTRIAFTVP